ncbi:MAG: hypothetical protein MK165_14450 [Pirellulaceae bacterium]|nr:hypothetical protein [Pirellulaceae bacterium]
MSMGANSSIIIQAIGILGILFVIFAAVMSRKTFHWFHITMFVFVFGAAITCVFYASYVSKTRITWLKAFDKLEADVQQKEKEVDEIEFGDLTVDVQKEPPDPEAPLVSCRNAIRRELTDRGPVWRECVIQNIAFPNLVVSTVPDGGQPEPHNIPTESLLYVFSEQTDEKLPNVYLGEFRVTGVTETELTLTPTIPLDQDQGRNVTGTLALYAQLPLDSHYAMADTKPLANYDLPVFGDFHKGDLEAKREYIRSFMPNRTQLPEEIYNARVEDFVRDGTRARDDDPPEHVYRRVRFEKKHEVEVDMTAPQKATDQDYFFDPVTGRALTASLRRGKAGDPVNAEMKTGAFGLFPTLDPSETEEAAVKQWIRDGICEQQEDVFVRPLIDFSYEFQRLAEDDQQRRADIALLDFEIKQVQEAERRRTEHIAYRQQERDKLETDLQKFVQEQDEAANYLTSLEEKWTRRRQDLSRLYQTNLLLEQQLEQISVALTKKIDEQSSAVTQAP